jgi:hypothetical protein
MRGSALVLLGGFGVVALFGCSPLRGRAPAPSEEGVGLVKNGSSIVLTSALLHLENRSLLDVLHRRLPNLQIDATADCPEVFLRGRSSIMNASNASIYVDGQRAANTCILESLYAFDLERVEVYPMGVTSRPGYFSDADGLILVFLRRGDH